MIEYDATDLQFLETLLKPSLVLIHVGGEETQTGFFVSDQGEICTCFHGLFLRETEALEITWQTEVCRAECVLKLPALDFALLRILETERGGQKTPALPVYTQPIDAQLNYHPALTLGYAGLENKDLPISQRLFLGQLVRKHVQAVQERIEFLDLGVGRGNSSAPIFDLHLFRVVGYVRRIVSQVQRLGDGLTLRPLIENRQDLLNSWHAIGEQFDAKIVHYHRVQSKPFQPAQLSQTIAAALIRSYTQEVIRQFQLTDVFIDALYQERKLEGQIQEFLKETEKKILVLAGVTGAGKTNLLAHLVQILDPQTYLPLLIICQAVESADPFTEVGSALQLKDFSLAKLGTVLQAFPNQTFLVILEGFNEWAHADYPAFKNLLADFSALCGTSALNLKLILSVRSEFLQEKVSDFYFPKSTFEADFDRRQLLFHDEHQQKPYLELKSLHDHKGAELEAMYTHYRETGSFLNASGLEVGVRPLTPFEQLPERMRRLLNRPIILRLFMMRYHRQEVPQLSVRSAFIDDIVYPTIVKESGAELLSEEVSLFLMQLAFFIFKVKKGAPCPFAELQEQPWYDKLTLEYLLSNSLYLQRQRLKDPRRITAQNEIRFQADWLFEYFLALYIWERGLQPGQAKANLEYIYQLQDFASSTQTDSHFLGALLFVGEWAVTKDEGYVTLILSLINDHPSDDFSASFTHALLEHLREGYSLSEPIPLASGETGLSTASLFEQQRRHFKARGLSYLLDYIEYLEGINETKDALTLLTLSDDFWNNAPPDSLPQRQVSLAFNYFQSHDIDRALAIARQVETNALPPDLQAKQAFILGRCLQFRQQYAEAIPFYEKGLALPVYYGYMCQHQLAFIELIAYSNYVKAAQILENLLTRMGRDYPLDQQIISRSLHAQCLMEMGKYAQAQDRLGQILEITKQRRSKQAPGKVLRALAELYLRQFNAPKAVETIEVSLEKLDRLLHYLSKAHALNIRANIFALLTGDLSTADQDIDFSLEAYRRAQHRPGLSWSLQTKALILALNGQGAAIEPVLAEASQMGYSYSQELRADFIRLLAQFLSAGSSLTELRQEIGRLQAAYLDRGYGWYPGVLALMLAALDHRKPTTDLEALYLFDEDIDAEGLMQSHLYQRLFQARDLPRVHP